MRGLRWRLSLFSLCRSAVNCFVFCSLRAMVDFSDMRRGQKKLVLLGAPPESTPAFAPIKRTAYPRISNPELLFLASPEQWQINLSG